ncbi:MAG: hypothetical protein ABR575_00445 [Actinomycetota bacterium]
MGITAFCTSCQRTVYVEEDHTAVCPVCSTPLLETAPPAPTDQTEGAK